MPIAPGRAADYSPQRSFRFVVAIFYAPDEPVLIGVKSPPRDNHEAPDNPEEPPATPDDTSSDDDTGDDDFQSAHSSDNNSDPDSPPGGGPGPEVENAPKPDTPTQEDLGSNPGEGTSGETPALGPNPLSQEIPSEIGRASCRERV